MSRIHRTLARVLVVDEESNTAFVVFPAWSVYLPVTVLLTSFPDRLREKMLAEVALVGGNKHVQSSFRCHVRIDFDAEDCVSLNPHNWEE